MQGPAPALEGRGLAGGAADLGLGDATERGRRIDSGARLGCGRAERIDKFFAAEPPLDPIAAQARSGGIGNVWTFLAVASKPRCRHNPDWAEERDRRGIDRGRCGRLISITPGRSGLPQGGA
jgi:hypothetical protein